jgi:hypothetical protein
MSSFQNQKLKIFTFFSFKNLLLSVSKHDFCGSKE